MKEITNQPNITYITVCTGEYDHRVAYNPFNGLLLERIDNQWQPIQFYIKNGLVWSDKFADLFYQLITNYLPDDAYTRAECWYPVNNNPFDHRVFNWEYKENNRDKFEFDYNGVPRRIRRTVKGYALGAQKRELAPIDDPKINESSQVAFCQGLPQVTTIVLAEDRADAENIRQRINETADLLLSNGELRQMINKFGRDMVRNELLTPLAQRILKRLIHRAGKDLP